jgi:hypothetical protein
VGGGARASPRRQLAPTDASPDPVKHVDQDLTWHPQVHGISAATFSAASRRRAGIA